MTPATAPCAPPPPFVATLVEHPPTALGRVIFTVTAPSRDGARRTAAAYRRRWRRHNPKLTSPVEGHDSIWRATGYRWVWA